MQHKAVYLLFCKLTLHIHFYYNQRMHIHKLRGLSPHANYTDRAAAAGRRS